MEISPLVVTTESSTATSDSQLARLEALLSSRRQMLPSEEYFQSVLPEFRRRLHLQSIRQPSLWEIIRERAQMQLSTIFASILPDFSHGMRLATAGCSALVCVLAVTAGLKYTWQSSDNNLMTLAAGLTNDKLSAQLATQLTSKLASSVMASPQEEYQGFGEAQIPSSATFVTSPRIEAASVNLLGPQQVAGFASISPLSSLAQTRYILTNRPASTDAVAAF